MLRGSKSLLVQETVPNQFTVSALLGPGEWPREIWMEVGEVGPELLRLAPGFPHSWQLLGKGTPMVSESESRA